jgi:hypothetical protein
MEEITDFDDFFNSTEIVSKSDIYLLSAIQKFLELKKNYKSFKHLILRIENIYLKQKIFNEISRNNIGNVLLLIDETIYNNIGESSVLYNEEDIKTFDFDFIRNTNISFLKKELGVKKLTFFNDEYSSRNDLKYWDFVNRIAVIIDIELSNQIEENPKLILNIEKELINSNLGYYTRFEITKVDYENDPFLHRNPSSVQKVLNTKGIYSNDDEYQHDPSESYRSNYENPWADAFGDGEEANTAYWNTD